MKESGVDQLPRTTTEAESKFGENYQNSLEKLKASNTEMLNCINY